MVRGKVKSGEGMDLRPKKIKSKQDNDQLEINPNRQKTESRKI